MSKSSKQWLEEVVPYIITQKEKEVFISLPSEVERGKFIGTFWKKRDPNPQTPENEYKIEYYKRIAGANKLFGTGGIAGWRTDRGKIFILLGPPKEIQRDMNPSSSQNNLASTFSGPKETWQYWGLPNPKLPYNMEFAFVDRYNSGNFMLENAFRVDSGRNRPFDMSDVTYQFDYLEYMAEAQKNPFEGFDKLKEIITTQVSYTHIPFRSELFFFKGAEGKTYIPLVFEILPAALTSKRIDDKYYFSVTLILNISNSLGQLVFEKSKDLNFQMTSPELNASPQKPFLVETALVLEPGSYKLHQLILDNFSGKVGTSHDSLTAPSFGAGELSVSDILLTSQSPAVSMNNEAPSAEEKIPTRAVRTFRRNEELNVYLEIYNLVLDEATGLNKFNLDYAFLQGGNLLTRVPSSKTKPTLEKDCRVRISFRLKNFKPADYILQVNVTDEISGKTQVRETPLTVTE